MENSAKKVIPKPKNTEILVESEEFDYPHCIIPPYFFEKALADAGQAPRATLSIATWDGRPVLSVNRQEAE